MENNLKEKYDKFIENKNNLADFKAKSKTPKLLRETLVTDGLTGEVIGNKIEAEFTSSAKEPAFIKLYIDDLILINDLPSSSSNILWELIKGLTYDNQIVLNSSIKKRICSNLDIKMPTLNNALTKFTKKEILYRVEPGIFLPNPFLFAKGSWNEVKALRLLVDYSPNGTKTIQAEINGECAIDTHTEEDLDKLNQTLNFESEEIL